MAHAPAIIPVPAATVGVAATAQKNCAHMAAMVSVVNVRRLAIRQSLANAKRK